MVTATAIPTAQDLLRTDDMCSLTAGWARCVVHTEGTLHQVAPYIGKIKSSIAASLVRQFTAPGDTVYDPFCGSGTVLLEAWSQGRRVVGTDLSPYARLLTRAKLFPPRTEAAALRRVAEVAQQVQKVTADRESLQVDSEVRRFFHPKTLREIIAWVAILRDRRENFLLAALLGILHHQRPGFLSYPSSHTVPYLRTNLFPRAEFREMYEYRAVRERLEKKVHRAFRRIPVLDRSVYRRCFARDAADFTPPTSINAIITSPPYMRQLDYGRDNRLRLWFLGESDWGGLDDRVTPGESDFLKMMDACLTKWRHLLPTGALCVLVLGDSHCRTRNLSLPEAVRDIAVQKVKGFRCEMTQQDPIPPLRRVRRSYHGSAVETVLVLKRVATV